MKKIVLSMIVAGAALMAADGATLYKACAGCHGADGKTKALGKSAPIAGMDAAQVEKKLKGYKDGSLNKYGMGGTMKAQMASKSDEDIKALAEHISKMAK